MKFKSLPLLPDLFEFDLVAVTTQVVCPEVETIQLGEFFYLPPDKAMKVCVRLVEDAYPDAVSAAPSVLTPIIKTLFRIDVPFIQPVVIGNGGPFCGGLAITDGLPGAGFGALPADFAHLSGAQSLRV